jgi:orotate phosphoribosyltransferase
MICKRPWKNELGELKKEVCKILVKVDALKFGTFRLTSGKLSPYYIDLRLIPSYPEVFQKIVKIYAKLAENEIGLKKFDRIAGIPTAGIPFSSALALELRKPFLYIRKEIKAHGRERRVEGIIMPGDYVLLVDDLVTTGGSLIKAAEALRAEGAIVKDALVLINREEGAIENLKKNGIKLHFLLGIREASRILYDMGIIDEERLRLILKQIIS